MPSPAAPSLVLTGERTLPGIPAENYWFRRHEAAYTALAPFVRGAVVVEAGCGEGYGANLFAATASRVVAVDYDAASIGHVSQRYPALAAVRADLQRLPLAAGTVDVVANLQVIEHLHDQAGFLRECARVLRPAGTLLVTTPNRLTFSPDRSTPLNPFHTRELAAVELAELLAPYFLLTRMLGLRPGRRLARADRRHGDLVDAALAGPPESWSRSVRQRVESVRADDFNVTAADIDGSLDLLAVAIARP